MKISKGTIYALIENITPPIIFKSIKNSSVYKRVVYSMKNDSLNTSAQTIRIEAGDIEGYTLKLDPDGNWQREMLLGTYDKELFSYLKKENLSGKVIYDIGAHICYHSLIFSSYVGKNGQVFAFEPNPTNFTRSKEIIALNPEIQNIKVFDLALSDFVGTTNFLSSEDIELGTSSGGFIDEASTLWNRSDYLEKTGFTESQVKVETIDSLVNQKIITAPDVMKIDVEGAEQLTLAGASETISKHHPIIIVEFHSIFSAYKCMEILTQNKYNTVLLKKEPDGRVLIC